LPSVVEVTLEDGSTVNANVTWDTSSYNGSTAGTYTLTGTIVNPTNVTNTGSKTASMKVTVQAAVPVTKNISSVGTIEDKTVANGTTVDLLNLPSVVEVTLEDGSTVNANVT
ncbi:Ig-like domain-containing protein, partial [Clostridium sp. A1-XYC3]